MRTMWSAGEVALTRSNPPGKSKRNGIEPPQTSYSTSVDFIGTDTDTDTDAAADAGAGYPKEQHAADEEG